MKIAHLPSTFLPTIGGAEICVHNIAREQQSSGHDVTVIAQWSCWRAVAGSAPYQVLPLMPLSVGLAKRGFQSQYWTDALIGWQLQLYQRLYAFDVWHVHVAYPMAVLARAALKRMGVPSVVTCQGADIQMMPEIGYGARLDPAVDREVATTLRTFDMPTAISNSVRLELLDLGVEPEKIRDVPNGADVARISALPSHRAAVRERLGWPDDRTILLTVGRNHPKKDYKLIPYVVAELRKMRDDFLWVIVGRGTGPIGELAEELGVSDLVQIIPEIGMGAESSDAFVLPADELVRVYKAADIFAFPSMLESFGIVLVEAMAAGLPVVATDVPGCRDVVSDGRDGLLSPKGEANPMAANLNRLLADPELRNRLAAEARRKAVSYGWDRVAAQYVACYEELRGRRGAGVGS